MDEPLSSIDATRRLKSRVEIKSIQRQLGVTTVYVTHDQEEAVALADRVAILEGGRLVQVGKVVDLLERPENIFVAGFLGNPAMNLFPGRIAKAADGSVGLELVGTGHLVSLQSLGLNRLLTAGQDVKVGVRASDVLVVDKEAVEERSPRNLWVLEATVDLIEGFESPYALFCSSGIGSIAARVQAQPSSPNIVVAIPVRTVMLFDTNSGKRIGG